MAEVVTYISDYFRHNMFMSGFTFVIVVWLIALLISRMVKRNMTRKSELVSDDIMYAYEDDDLAADEHTKHLRYFGILTETDEGAARRGTVDASADKKVLTIGYPSGGNWCIYSAETLPVIVGSAEDADVRITGKRGGSYEYARIYAEGDRYMLELTHEAKGYANGKRIHKPVSLGVSNEIKIENTILMINIERE